MGFGGLHDMTKSKYIAAAFLAVLVALAISLDWRGKDSQVRQLWQQAIVPGSLSQSHAFLENNCAACHVPVTGIQPSLCISCHADNKSLLQRQPTAFHANIQRCSGCHTEHQGTRRMPTTMDHAVLVNAVQWESGAQQSDARDGKSGLTGSEIQTANRALADVPRVAPVKPGTTAAASNQVAQPCDTPGGCQWSQVRSAVELPGKHPLLSVTESNLSCVSCHATKDRHQGMLGNSCVQCHATTEWTVSDFRHPSVNSTVCAQCHKPPPSHNMMHFSMMSAPIAGQPNAKVNQCYLCHQTTSWNDIKGVGWKKLH
jgi:hypothetical protein